MAVVTHGSGAAVAPCHHIWLQDETSDEEAKLFPVRFSSHPRSCKGSRDARVFPAGTQRCTGARALGDGEWGQQVGHCWGRDGETRWCLSLIFCTGAELWTGFVLVHDAVCCTPLRVRQMPGILGMRADPLSVVALVLDQFLYWV